MKRAINIQVGEKTYPFRMTLGAMLRFKRLTGKEATELNQDSVEEVASLLYACLASASAADKIPFSLTFDEFADLLSTEDMENMMTLITEPTEQPTEQPGDDAGEQKKR